jgi:hypothetical protein
VNFKMVRQDFSIFCCKFPLSHLNHTLLRFMYFFVQSTRRRIKRRKFNEIS